MTNSNAKGKRGELEVVHFLREHGISARRGQQYSGGGDSPDVVSAFPHIHLEVKRVERGSLYDWLQQAQEDCAGKVPVVVHKRNHHEWVAILPLADFIEFVKRDVTYVEPADVVQGPRKGT